MNFDLPHLCQSLCLSFLTDLAWFFYLDLMALLVQIKFNFSDSVSESSRWWSWWPFLCEWTVTFHIFFRACVRVISQVQLDFTIWIWLPFRCKWTVICHTFLRLCVRVWLVWLFYLFIIFLAYIWLELLHFAIIVSLYTMMLKSILRWTWKVNWSQLNCDI